MMKTINLPLLKEAIHEYREEGRRLMMELGKKYNLDINNPDECYQLLWRGGSVPRKGELSKRWNYSFHGGECGFHNKKSQQRVEVVLSNAPTFGHIDPWFLMLYLESTEKYKKELGEMVWTDLKALLETLYKTGEIAFI